MTDTRTQIPIATNSLPRSGSDVAYPPSEIPMSVRDWSIAAVLVAVVLTVLPMAWRRLEPPPAGADYRIPLKLADDYWLFDRLRQEAANDQRILVIGDSVVWGHYVSPEWSLPAQLNDASGTGRFANLGVDGIHPVALEGLIRYYGGTIAGRDVVLHCNLLWMSSPRHDLRERKPFPLNHSRLLPQLRPWIACSGESLSGRLEIAVARAIPLTPWTEHLRLAYFGGADLPTWMLRHPYEAPFSRAAMAAIQDCAGPPEADGKTWRQRGAEFAPRWVDMDNSIQWASFRQTVELLRQRQNRVFVIIGPLNEHMMDGPARAAYRDRVRTVRDWLDGQVIANCAPAVLSSDQYADASHPLSTGYATLARGLLAQAMFSGFVRAENLSSRSTDDPSAPR